METQRLLQKELSLYHYKDKICGTINATADNSQITSTSNYLTYTVTKNGTYPFKATTQDGKTVDTVVKVNNIETFKPIEEVSTTELSENAYGYKGAAVPKGYFVDTKSEVDTGLVITDEIDGEGYAIGNEWVWVPVNSTVGNDDYYIEESGTFAGAETVTYSKYGKLYSFSTPRTRDAYGTLYPSGNSSTATLGKPSQTSGYREPSLLTSSKYSEATNYAQINKRSTGVAFTSEEGAAGIATQYKDDYENMITSVDTYGGFYIGRYEITANGEKAGDSLTDVNWYALYNECMKFDDESVTSGMMYGTLWDATMQWMSSNYNVGYTGNKTSGYGNYIDEAVTVGDNDTTIIVKPSGRGQKLKTGQTSYTKSNNIYDLSGNCSDWTQEANGNINRNFRGGTYSTNSSNNTFIASRNWGAPMNTNSYTSSRSYFYIKYP